MKYFNRLNLMQTKLVEECQKEGSKLYPADVCNLLKGKSKVTKRFFVCLDIAEQMVKEELEAVSKIKAIEELGRCKK